jgi:hypothetical protein
MLHSYYQHIHGDQLQLAYQMRSNRSRDSTSYIEFCDTWSNNRAISLDECRVLWQGKGRGKASVRLTAHDLDRATGASAVTTYVGTIKLTFERGAWRYDGGDLHAVDRPAVEGQAASLAFDGMVSYRFNGSNLKLTIPAIRCDSPEGQTSGSLKISLWAANGTYSGGPQLNGYRLATKNLHQMRGGERWRDLNLDLKMSHPPSGSYWMVVTLEEFTQANYTIRCWVSFPNQQRFN